MDLGRHRIVLAVGAHPDDIELGCAGTLALAQSKGAEVHEITFSACTDEAPPGREGERRDQALRASGVLGTKARVLDFPNRRFPEHRDEIMEEMARLQEGIRPTIVLTPFLEDPHQDHSAVAQATIRTFRRNETIVQYEILRYGSHTFTPNVFVDITGTLDRKIAALREYRTQFERRAYFDEESFRSLARTRGAQGGLRYAEGFVAYKIYW